jgi:hypothetical protein
VLAAGVCMCPKVGGRSRRVQKFVSMESSGACSRNNRKAPSSSFFKPKSRSYAGRLEKALGKEPRSMWMRPRYCMFSTYWLTETRDTWPRSRTSIRPLFIVQSLPQSRQAPAAHEKMSLRHEESHQIRNPPPQSGPTPAGLPAAGSSGTKRLNLSNHCEQFEREEFFPGIVAIHLHLACSSKPESRADGSEACTWHMASGTIFEPRLCSVD